MVTLVIALQQERKAPRPTFSNAYDYYSDFNAERRTKKFTYKSRDFNLICKATNSTIPITRKEQDLLADISNMIKASPNGLAYLSHEGLSRLTGNNKRQNNVMRKNLSHILQSKWKKKIKIDGVVRSKVIIFKHTPEGKIILNNSGEYYGKIKAGTPIPISINKDEKYIKEDRSSKSSFCKNSNSSQAKVYSPKFKQYYQLKTLGEHYPLTAEDCSELQRRSGREFTLNAMNEILLDMSRKLKESKHKFPSKAAFMAYMRKVYRYEGRDAVKTANSGFKILARAPEAEVIAHTTQAERDSYLNSVEQRAITHRSDESQYRAKLVGALEPSAAYNFLSNLKTVCKVGDVFEVHMSQNILLTDHSRTLILSAANAVGGYSGVKKMEFIEKQEVTKHAN